MKITKAGIAQRRAAGKKSGDANRKPDAWHAATGHLRGAKPIRTGPALAVPATEPRPLDKARIKALVKMSRTPIRGYPPARDAGLCRFEPEAAHRVIEFFRCKLRHAKGELTRQPFELAPWQEAILANLFGWLRPDGSRRYREAFIYVPKKQGKTSLAGGLIVYMLAEDPEEGQENYSAAATREQASLVFQQASSMIRQSPDLSGMMRVFGAQGGSQHKRIVKDKDGVVSFYAALAADASHADGSNVHFAIVDEFHEHPNSDMADILQKGTAARRNPLVLYISTADYDRPESPCNAKREYALMVRDGRIKDPYFLPAIYEADAKADWTSPKVWKDCNPNFGVSVKKEFFEREVQKCKADPSKINDFKRYHLNIISGQAEAWLPMESWDECAGNDAEDPVAWRKAAMTALAGMPCTAGLDLGATSDLSALVLRFRLAGDVAVFLPWFWMPKDGIKKKSPDHARIYDSWLEAKFIKGTDGNVCDYDVVRDDITDIASRFKIQDIAFDPHNATQLAGQLQNERIEVVQFIQAIKYMAEPTKKFGERVLGKKMMHGGNPVLRWMFGNCRIKTYRGNIMVLTKGVDPQRKIDGIVAAVMSEGRALVAPSTYSSRGMVVI